MRAEDELHPPPLHLGRHVGADVLVKSPQDLVAAIDQGHIDAHAVENACELHGNEATADDHDPLWQGGEVEGLLGGHGEVRARQVFRLPGTAACGDEDALCGDRSAALDLETVGTGKDGTALQDLGTRPGQVGHIEAGKTGDLAVLRLPEAAPVKGRPRGGPAVALGDVGVVGELRGVDHELLGHAAPDHAGAADPVFLCHGDPCARGRGQASCPDPAGPGTDDKEIVVKLAHGRTPLAADRV